MLWYMSCCVKLVLTFVSYDCPPHLETSLILSKSNTIRAAHGSLSGHRVWMSLSSADSRRREMHYTVRAWNHSLTSPALLLSSVQDYHQTLIHKRVYSDKTQTKRQNTHSLGSRVIYTVLVNPQQWHKASSVNLIDQLMGCYIILHCIK